MSAVLFLALSTVTCMVVRLAMAMLVEEVLVVINVRCCWRCSCSAQVLVVSVTLTTSSSTAEQSRLVTEVVAPSAGEELISSSLDEGKCSVFNLLISWRFIQ